MNIAIVNQNVGNFGDDWAGRTLIDLLRAKTPDASVHVVFNTGLAIENNKSLNFPNVVQHTNCYLGRRDLYKACLALLFGQRLVNSGILPRHLVELVEVLLAADLVIVSPCGANLGKYTDWLFLYRILLATRLSKPVVFHLNTLGRSKSRVFDILAKYCLLRSTVFTRETSSHRILREWNIPHVVGADTAFADQRFGTGSYITEGTQERYQCLIPSELKWVPTRHGGATTAVDNLVTAATRVAMRSGAKLKILSHYSGRQTETALLRRVVEHARSIAVGRIEIEPIEPADLDEYLSVIAGAAYCYSMRYHGVVAALRAHIPLLSVSYETKMCDLSTYAGVPWANIKIDDPRMSCSDKLCSLIDANEPSWQERRHNVDRTLDELLNRLANAPTDHIQRLMLGGAVGDLPAAQLGARS